MRRKIFFLIAAVMVAATPAGVSYAGEDVILAEETVEETMENTDGEDAPFVVAEDEEDSNIVDLRTQTVEISRSYDTVVYDGEAKEPDVTVYCEAIKLTEGVDYTVSYANNADLGTQATVIITGIGGYEGSVTATFSIVETYDGVCGDNLTWTLNTDGLLTISGTGDMYDFEIVTYGYVDDVWTYAATIPWYNVRES